MPQGSLIGLISFQATMCHS